MLICVFPGSAYQSQGLLGNIAWALTVDIVEGWGLFHIPRRMVRNSNFSGTEQFFLGTQAFASPPDMASSGVWENIVLYKTPTFDGVCGMLYYII